jgi:SAM-dependent methyltransferase
LPPSQTLILQDWTCRNRQSAALVSSSAQAWNLVLGDMERLPFVDDCLDAITSNWTLYFMRDIATALAEMRRCVRPSGLFVAATVAPDHMIEFDKVVADAVHRALGRPRDRDISFRFDTISGRPLIRDAFDSVELREYTGEMVLPDVETVMTLWPGYGPQLIDPAEDAAARAEFETLMRAHFADQGMFYNTRHDGVFVARA